MPRCGKSWRDKLAQPRSPKKVRLDAPFAGIPAGTLLFVGTPQIIDAYIRKVPAGETRTVLRLRRDLARQNGCEATCPVSTAVFIRMVAEAALEDLDAGLGAAEVTPFWRVVEPDSTIARKLPVDAAWLRAQRAREAPTAAA